MPRDEGDQGPAADAGPVAGTALTLAALVGAVALLWWLGGGPLGGPDGWSGAAVARWVSRPDVTVTALGVVRLVALGLGVYSCALTALDLAGRVTHRPRLVDVATRLTLPPLRRSLATVGGLTLSTVGLVVAGSGVASPAGSRSPTPVLVRLPDERAATADDHHAAPTPDLMDPSPAPAPPVAIDPPTPEPAPDPTRLPEPEWVVAPGDHLWHIAEARLAQAWGRAPTDAEVGPHWSALIEANRSRLVDPDAPDLLLPGQTLLLVPPPPPAPAPDAAA